VIGSLSDRLRQHLTALVGDRHPVTCPKGLQDAEDYLAREFHSLGLEVTTHPFEAMGGRYRNVIGTLHLLGGTSPLGAPSSEAPPLLIAAHYDTVPRSPGADDNASGLAVMLEAARSLSRSGLIRPVRFVAFCLEEEELLGSRAYAAHLRAAQEEILGAIVLECVGCARSEEGSQQAPPGLPLAVPTVGDFLGIVGNQASAALTATIERAARHAVADLKTLVLLVPGQGELFPDTRRSDHAAFWQHGYPAVMLTDTANYRNPHYHQPTDTIETLNLDFMDKVTRLLVATVESLSLMV
jgi:Zn-dependent M28 family amino/carboxypeptidase